MNIHVSSTDPDEASFEAVSAEIGDTLFVFETETFAVVDQNEEEVPFLTRWVGEEAIIELADSNWFSVVGMLNERSDRASTDFASPVSIALMVKDFDPKDMMSAVRIGGEKLRIDQPWLLESGATIALKATGRILYDPNGAFDGLEEGRRVEDVFSYSISNSEGGFAMEAVKVTVSGDRGFDTIETAVEGELEVEGIFDSLFGTMATLQPNGAFTYFESAPFDAMDAKQIDIGEEEGISGGDVTINFIQ